MTNLHWPNRQISSNLKKRKCIYHGTVWIRWKCNNGWTNQKQQSSRTLTLISSHGKKLTSRGLKPKLMTLDNEASKLLKDYLRDQDINFQLVPPYCHRRNAAEHAIHSFKDHLIAGVCSTDKAFPSHLCDRLLPQAILTLDMLRTSRISPKISAAMHLDRQYEYDRAPMAPTGTIIIAHETPNRRRTRAPHGQDGLYIGPALEHYRCYTVYINKTRS
jgi:hypothetical protein